MISLLLIAVSLALDAFAVSVSSGICVRNFSWRQALLLGVWFGAFQFMMPVAGYFLGVGVAPYIVAIDHWVAFGLLAIIGGRMLHASFQAGKEDRPAAPDLSPVRLTVLAIATSIDALAVGVSMAFMTVDILPAAALIGAVAFALSVLGGMFGKRVGGVAGKWSESLGGLVLIGIGVKILFEHLS